MVGSKITRDTEAKCSMFTYKDTRKKINKNNKTTNKPKKEETYSENIDTVIGQVMSCTTQGEMSMPIKTQLYTCTSIRHMSK